MPLPARNSVGALTTLCVFVRAHDSERMQLKQNTRHEGGLDGFDHLFGPALGSRS